MISSTKPKADPQMQIGDRLVAINSRMALGSGKAEVKTLWKEERGASEVTVLYFQRCAPAGATELPDVAEATEEEVEKESLRPGEQSSATQPLTSDTDGYYPRGGGGAVAFIHEEETTD